MNNETIIGLEVHLQLNTASKLFCNCSTQATEPNSNCCEVCLGMPGSKPMLNKKAVQFALRVALALNCKINTEFYFSRKTYFYPDMAKNFQITQFEIPIGCNGSLSLKNAKKVRIKRVHLEEDPAALVHEQGMQASNYCLVDYNRSGIPLLEIVTEPDLNGPAEAREFLDVLLNCMNYLNVFETGKNTLKVDSNVSIKGFERVEVKNITGFKAVETALEFEVQRQKTLVEKGQSVKRETRAFDEQSGTTRNLRTKETEEGYGYIFEPDLAMIEISKEELEKAQAELPELPEEKAKRLTKEFGLNEYDSKVLCGNFELSKLFDEVAKQVDAKLAARFLSRELLAIMNWDRLSLSEIKLPARKVIEVLKLLQNGKITEKTAKETMIKTVHERIEPLAFIEKQGLVKSMIESEIEKICEKVIAENKKTIEDFKKGENKALHYLIGNAMKKARGMAEPRTVQKIITEKLEKLKRQSK